MIHFLKNILQLILAPGKAWAEIADENVPPSRILEQGFYPLLALTAVTAFVHGFFGAAPFSIAASLEAAVAQFLALFLGLMIARVALEAGLPYISPKAPDNARSVTFAVYSLSILAVIQIAANLCPVSLAVLWFLPAFIIVVIWHARQYLDIARERYGIFVVSAFAVLVLVPILIAYILDQLF